MEAEHPSPVAKIILIGSAHPFRGGLAAFNERLLSAWLNQGHQACIYTFTVQYPEWLFPGKSQYSNRPRPELPIRQAIHSLNPINWFRHGLHIRRLKPDLLVFKFWLPYMGPCFGTLARLVRGNHATRVTAILDNVIPHEHRVGDKLFTRYFLKACDCFVVMSAQVERDLSNLGFFQPILRLFHPPYDYGPAPDQKTARKLLNLPDDGLYALFFGFVRRYKGLDLLLEALADARLRSLNIKLLVAGEFYEPVASYRHMVEELNLVGNVIFHDWFIEDEHVPLYLSACDLVVLPYREATQSGIAHLAFHYGKPVLATAVGGLPEVIIPYRNGLLADPHPTALAEALYKLADRELLFRLSQGTSSPVEQLWDRFAASVVEGCLGKMKM
ncbi:MAG: glycosyltransferase [Chitinophagales bacterium]|nr:glycosyltransferase [Chitinophagales bacterium]MDW8427059.1 glycosyltransferase [Chitinophagales bacterium]